MYDLFSSYEASDIITRWKVKTYKILGYIMFAVGAFLTIEFLVLAFFLEAEAEAAMFFLLPFGFVMALIGFVSLKAGNNRALGKKEVVEVRLFNEYQTEYTKIPAARLSSSNKNNSEYAVMLLLGTDTIDVNRLNRSLRKLASYPSEDTVFNFYVNTKNGQYLIKRKFYITHQRKHHKYYLMKGSEDKVVNFIKSNGYYYQIFENNILTQQHK
jgi:hypothetical protein